LRRPPPGLGAFDPPRGIGGQMKPRTAN
jgi:hypothetical protein